MLVETCAALRYIKEVVSVSETNVSEAEEFRKQASEARQMAAECLHQSERRFWLGLADDWTKLAEKAEQADRKDHRYDTKSP